MSKTAKKRYSAEFKAKVAFGAIRGEKTISQLASEYGIHGTSINQWRRELLKGASQVFEGSRKMTALLRRSGHVINRKKVQRLMRQLGIQAIYAKPNTSQPHPKHPIYPYLLKGLEINRSN